jgi:hypothetical protein
MKKTTIFSMGLVLLLVFATWAPAIAQATGAPLTIKNPLPKSTVVNLDGAKDYSFTVGAGQTINKTIDKGNYKVKYVGCLGKPTNTNLKLKGGKYELNIKPCKMAKWTIVNPSSKTFTSELNGWMTYRMTVGPGQTKTFDIVAGPYDFKNACGGDTWTGKVKVGGNKTWLMCP